jgi:hypothetical protein
MIGLQPVDKIRIVGIPLDVSADVWPTAVHMPPPLGTPRQNPTEPPHIDIPQTEVVSFAVSLPRRAAPTCQF